jgi:hypothetical protein
MVDLRLGGRPTSRAVGRAMAVGLRAEALRAGGATGASPAHHDTVVRVGERLDGDGAEQNAAPVGGAIGIEHGPQPTAIVAR